MPKSELLGRLDALIEKLERLEKKKENPRKPKEAESGDGIATREVNRHVK